MESDADKTFSQTTLMQTSQRMTGQNDAVIAQREREINDIAKGIIELSDIFRDLQTMIIDQGTMLDRIDYNVERMGTDVKSAEKELQVVRLSPPSISPRCLCLRIDRLLIPTGYKLPTPLNQTEDNASITSVGCGHDRCFGRETEASISIRPGPRPGPRPRPIFQQYPVNGVDGSSQEKSLIEICARPLDGTGYIPIGIFRRYTGNS